MIYLHTFHGNCRRLRVGRFVKALQGIFGFAVVMGGSLLLPSAIASAQPIPMDCLPGSTGPALADPRPYPGGMCNLGTLLSSDSRSAAFFISADGSVVGGQVTREDGFTRAVLWDAATGQMRDLGSFRTDEFGFNTVTNLSSDGTVVVGGSQNNVGVVRAFRWDATSGVMTDIGSFQGDDRASSSPIGMTQDGNFIVGNADLLDASGVLTSFHAFRWDAESGQMRDLGTLRTDNSGNSLAWDISADGRFVVGYAATNDLEFSRAFRWDGATGTMTDLGALRENNQGLSNALAVSADGSVVVGDSQSNTEVTRAFRWDATSGMMRDLGTLRTDNSGVSSARFVSADGSVVVGSADTNDSSTRVFRWDTTSSSMMDLGSLRGDNQGWSFARGGNQDLTFIVGQAITDDDAARAFRWDAASGSMLDLGTLRTDNKGFSVAYAVSEDGAVVVGYSGTENGGDNLMTWNSTARAFIWRTQMQDFTNLLTSFPVLANETEVAVAGQQYVLGRLMDETCLAEADQACLRVGGWLTNTDNATGLVDGGTSGIATLTYGRGLDGQTTVGGTLSISGGSADGGAFDMGSGVGVSLWAEYSEGGLARTGWQAGAAIGWGRESGSITRGLGLANVMPATGDSRLETFGVRATLGYGFQQQDWLITPSLSLAHFRTSRSGYVETGSDFNASYDDLSVDRTVATLALSGERAIGERGLLFLSAGLEHDLSADPVALTGTSTLMGMQDFSVLSALERRETRGFVDLGYTHDLGDNRSLSGSLRVGQAVYGDRPQVSIGVYYGVRF